MERIALKVIL